MAIKRKTRHSFYMYQKTQQWGYIIHILMNDFGMSHIEAQNWTNLKNENFGGSSPKTLWEKDRGHKVIGWLYARKMGY